MGQGETGFTLQVSSEKQAVFENPEHDFPQRIIYSREGNQLQARVEGPAAAGETQAQQWQLSLLSDR